MANHFSNLIDFVCNNEDTVGYPWYRKARMKLQNNYPSSFQPKSDESSSDKARAYNACCTNDVSTLSQLLEERRIFPRADKDSVCPETLLLHAAAANNAVDCLKALLKKGWQVDDTVQVDKDDSWTPLREAAKSSSPDAAKVLTERGAQVSLKVIDALYTGVSEAENPTALGTDRKEVMKVLVDVLTLERGEADAKRFDSIVSCSCFSRVGDSQFAFNHRLPSKVADKAS